MELLNASLLKGTVSTRNSTIAKAIEISTAAVVLPRTKVLVEGSRTVEHFRLCDE
jgi:hypothetical protein